MRNKRTDNEPKVRPGHLSAPYILWLIREQRVNTMGDLCAHLQLEKMGANAAVMARYGIAAILTGLENAGLIETDANKPDDSFGIAFFRRFMDDQISIRPTDQIQVVQAALGLDLVELSQKTHESIIVNPIFRNRQSQTSLVVDVFVLMPFAKNLLPVYEDHVCVLVKQMGMTVGRADDIFTTESVMEDIWNAIRACRLVIADCTNRNPNVFYEIGIAHTLGKKVVLITQSLEDVPFDLRHIRCIVYEFTPRGMAEFEEKLHRTLERLSTLDDYEE
ncbi:MAG: hypothetical protein V1799_00885 [bacterium]